MANSFDPYREWLGVETGGTTPDHYRLLGLEPFTVDGELISRAADTVMARVRRVRPGPHAAAWSRLLDELNAAKQCLLDPMQKAMYDDLLRGPGSTAKTTMGAADSVNEPPRKPTWAASAAPPKVAARPASLPPAAAASPATSSSPAEASAPQPSVTKSKVRLEDIPQVSGLSWMGPVVTCLAAMMVGLAGFLAYTVYQQGSSISEILRPISPSPETAPMRPVTRGTSAKRLASAASQRELVMDDHNEAGVGSQDRRASQPPAARPAEDVDRGTVPGVARGRPEPPPARPQVAAPEPTPAARVVDPAKSALFARAVAEARAAFAGRDLAVAEKQLAIVATNAQTAEDTVQLDRLEAMLDNLGQFWDGVRTSMARFQTAEELAYRDQRFVVVESGRDFLSVKTEGRIQRFQAVTLPSWLVMTIADRDFGKDPGSKAIIATFMAVDPYGNRVSARRYWEEAARAGFDCAKLLPELAEAYPTIEQNRQPAAQRR